MAFTEQHFAQLRPYLFHLTHRNNLSHLRKTRTLYCARQIMTVAVDTSFLRKKRPESMEFLLGTATVSVRDQAPLHAGNINLETGWSFEDFVQSLNERVFFWPGSQSGPNAYGQRHFARYASEDPAILRISTVE